MLPSIHTEPVSKSVMAFQPAAEATEMLQQWYRNTSFHLTWGSAMVQKGIMAYWEPGIWWRGYIHKKLPNITALYGKVQKTGKKTTL